MSSYRQWQANREVYLYPENYADPSLRKAQTPLFKDLVNTLNQGQLTDENIEKAIGQYLEGMAVVANLVVVDSYARKITLPSGDPGTELFVLGRGHQDPATFYVRRGYYASGKPSVWSPWEQLDFTINAEVATCIYAFNRLYVFWVQQVSKTIQDPSGASLQVVEATIYFTHQKHGGSWLQPQTLMPAFPVSVIDGGVYVMPQNATVLGWDLGTNYLQSPAWQRVWLQLLPASSTQEDRILVKYGDWIMYDTDAITISAQHETGLTSSTAKAWNKMLKDSFNYATQIGTGKWTSLVPGIGLVESGMRSMVRINVDDSDSQNIIGKMYDLNSAQNAAMVSGFHSVMEPQGMMVAAGDLLGGSAAYYKLDELKDSVFADSYGSNDLTIGVSTPLIAVQSKTDWNSEPRNVGVFPASFAASARLQGATALYFSKALTIAGWIYPTTLEANKPTSNTQHQQYQFLFGAGLANNIPGYALGLYQANNSSPFEICVWLGIGTTSTIFNFTVPTGMTMAINNWYHLACTWDSTSQKVMAYLNGVLCTPPPTSTFDSELTSYNANTNVAIGEVVNYEGYFEGYISEVFVAGTALSTAEIQTLYHGKLNLLGTVHSKFASTTAVSNRTGLFFANTGTEDFLCIPSDETGFMYVEDALTATYPNAGEVTLAFSKAMIPDTAPTWEFHRFGTRATSQFMASLVDGGPDALLQLQSQYASEPDFSNYTPNANAVTAPASGLIDFSGPMREYFWELFFHIPLYVGNLLQAQQQFALARKWYEYVFVPEGLPGLRGYWPLDGNLKAVTGKDGILTGSSDPWVSSTFADGRTRNVFHVANNGITLDPSLVPMGDTVSVSFWLCGNFPSINYAMSTAIISANAAPFPNNSNSTRLIDIFLLYNTTQSSTSTNTYWEAGNDSTGWDRVYKADSLDKFNGAWNFFAFTKNAATGSLKVYRNGTLWFDGTDQNRGMDYPAISFSVGGSYPAYLTELALWSVELSANEVMWAYQNKASASSVRSVWNFRPFAETAPATLAQTLTQAPAQLAISKYDPFDPDALAAIRWGAWEKNVFMHYVQNLIGWGDSLFTVDTWEAVSEATQLYVTAGDLLGIPPRPGGKLDLRKPVTYGQMEAKYGEGNIPEFLIDMETRVAAGATLPGGATVPAGVASILNGYFCIPDNQQLTQLWGLVANRLYKIRHGLNLQGQATQPALFGPPLNPADMVDGGAYGASGPSANNVQVPYYRFDQMIQLAKGFAQQVVSLGNELLAALEKQDGETLSQLRQTQESAIFNMTLQAKADMVNQLMQQQLGLQYSLGSAQAEQAAISAWATQQLLPEESQALTLGNDAMILTSTAAGVVGAASLVYLIMNIFGMADGGFNFGGSMEAISKALAASSQAINESAGLMREKAGYIRREQEWNLRLQTIGDSIGQIQAQLAANQFAIAAAQQDYSITQTQYQQSQDVLNFLQTKFTNEDLYVWMAGQLSTLYYQAYQMALELAQQAQTCYQYELSSSDSFLSGNPWNDQYKGLLAGDALSLSLSQMEKAYHDNNSRYQEIHKTFSLMQKDPQALLDLKQNGSCTFSFSELDFDLDFPGHYNRKIASISVTIPAVVGPYQNLNATLIQTSNQVLMKADIEGVKSLLGMAGAVPKQGSIRSNWAPNQQISISTGINDAGLFQLNFNDPQYLPFEGTGAISNWQLIMPKAANAFDFNAITDVIIQISYTSSPGGQTFAKQVTALDPVRNYRGTLYLSLRQQFSSAWYAFLNSSSDSQHQLGFQLLLQQFPVNLSPSSLSLGDSSGNAYLALSLAQGVDSSDLPLTSLNPSNGGGEWIPSTGAAPIGNADSFYDSSTQTLSPKLPWAITMDFSSSGQDLLDSSTGRIDPTKLLDIVLVVPFMGELSW